MRWLISWASNNRDTEVSINDLSNLQKKMIRLIIISSITTIVAGQCSFPEELVGNWTSSNYGRLTFSHSSPQFIMSFGAAEGTDSTSFDCLVIEGTQYILKSLNKIRVFEGTNEIYAYLCLDLRTAGPYSYYYYQNSAKETGFSGERIVGISEVVTDVKVSNVCTTTLDIAEFHTMVKVGFENEAAIQCADPLLLSASYSYTDGTGTHCSGLNTTIADTCNNNLTAIQFNTSLVQDSNCASKRPGWSSNGFLGCVVNIYDQNTTQYYISFYNFDDSVDNSATYRFTCAAVITDINGTVFLSLSPNDCATKQTATELPSNGALMKLSPFRTCVPVTTEHSRDWTWLIILCICLLVLILIIILAVLICRYIVHKKRKRARRKKMLADKHPLAEMSLHLDAPASLEKVPDINPLVVKDDAYDTQRESIKEKPMMNPMTEPSLLLDFKRSKWSIVKDRISTIVEDPFNEINRNEAVSVDPSANKVASRHRFPRQRSLIAMPPKSKFSKSSVNGGLPNRIGNGTFVINRQKPEIVQKEKHKLERANSLNAAVLHIEHTEPKIRTDSETTEQTVLSDKRNVTETRKINHPATKTENVKNISTAIRNNRNSRNFKKGSIISWTGKRLVRSQSNVGAKYGRGLTSTRLGSITTKKRPQNKTPLQRSQSFTEIQSETLQSSVELMSKNEDKGTAAHVTTETCEPASETLVSVNSKAPDKNDTITSPTPKSETVTNEQVQNTQLPESSIVPVSSPQDLSHWEDHMNNNNQVNDWLEINEKEKSKIDLNASFSGTYASFKNIRAKTDLNTKTLRPKASRLPWR